MSSLAATQADGYYVPVEYYESGAYKNVSKNQFNGSSGHNQYLQNGVVRFELPYDGFCQGCSAHVSKGTRFNAQKSKAGKYFSTIIWEFRMKCRKCASNGFLIRTNPKEQSFQYVEGIKQAVKDFDTKEAGTSGVIDTNIGNKILSPRDGPIDTSEFALDSLQTIAIGKARALTEQDQLKELLQANKKAYMEDFSNNSEIRASFRLDRKQKKRRLTAASKLGWSGEMELLSEDTTDDIVAAKSMTYKNGKYEESKRFLSLRKSSIFEVRKIAKVQKLTYEMVPDGVVSTPIKCESQHVRFQQPHLIKVERLPPRIKKLVHIPHMRAVSVATRESKHFSALDSLLAYDSDCD